MANHPPHTSAQFPFFPVNQDKFLFSVNSDAPVEDALSYASSFLLSALEVARETAETANNSKAWTIVYLIEMAEGVVHSCKDAIEMEGRDHG